jgi:alcohol dehydrogenase class IV
MRFEFSTVGRIIFGSGTVAEVPELAAKYGSQVFLVAGRSVSTLENLIDSLKQKGLGVTLFRTQGEPTRSSIEKGTLLINESRPDLVIGFGGGSILDAGKAIAAFATNPGEILDYLEVIGSGKTLISQPLPFIAIPTTSGTGSEVTRNAVIGLPDHRIKVSLRDAKMIPRIAVVDPELTYSLPPNITASTGLDALTQLIEPFVSRFSNPITDSFCREGMRRVSRSLLQAFKNGSNKDARIDMSLASLLGGLALANSGLGAVHGFAAPIGGMFSAPHGAVCAALLPHVVEANVGAHRNRSDDNFYLNRFEEIAKILTGSPNAEIEDGITWLNSLVENLNIPSLSTYSITTEDIPAIVEKAKVSSSMRGNSIQLTETEMTAILRESL